MPEPSEEVDDAGADEADVFEPDTGSIYDPSPQRESTRQILAIGVFVLLVATVAAILYPVIAGFRTWDEMQGVAASILPAVFGTTGTVLAFYFASEQREGS